MAHISQHHQNKILSATAILFLLLPTFLFSQPQNWTHFFQDGDLDDPMNNLFLEHDTVIWAIKAYQDTRIFKIDVNMGYNCQTTMTTFDSYKLIGEDSYNFHYLYSNSNDCIFLFTPDSIVKINKNQSTDRQTLARFSQKYPFRSIFEAKNTGIYAACTDGSIYTFKNNSLAFIGKPIDSAIINIKLFDSQNRLWCTARNKGLLFYKNGSWTSFRTDNSALKSNNFPGSLGQMMFETADGKIIAGSIDSGLQVFNNQTWSSFSPQPVGELERQTRCCARDSSGAIWLGTDGFNKGILRYYNQQWYQYTLADHKSFHAPCYNSSDIKVDSKNRVWISMLHDGVYMLDQSATPSQCSSTKKIKISSPIPQESILTGTKDTITWNTYGNIDSIRISYRTDVNAAWIKVTPKDTIFNRSFFSWTIPSIISNNYYVRIRDYKDTTVQDIVGPFSVVTAGINLPPKLQPLPDSIVVKMGQQTTLTLYASDPEKDILEFTCSTLPSWVSTKDSVLTFDPVTGSTSFTFTVTVSDGKGGIAIDSTKVVVETSSGAITSAKKTIYTRFTLLATSNELTLSSSETVSITRAILYDLSGRMIGRFVQQGKKYRLDNKNTYATGKVYLVNVSTASSAGEQKSVMRMTVQ